MTGAVLLLRLVVALSDGSGRDGGLVGAVLGTVLGTLLIPGVVWLVISRWSRRGAVAAFATMVLLLGLVTVVDRDPRLPVEVNDATRSLIEVVGEPEVSPEMVDCLDDDLDGAVTVDQLLDGSETDDARARLFQAVLDCEARGLESTFLAESMAVGLGLSVDGESEVGVEDGQCIVDLVVATSGNPARTLAAADQAGDAELLLDVLERCLDPQFLAFYGATQGLARRPMATVTASMGYTTIAAGETTGPVICCSSWRA